MSTLRPGAPVTWQTGPTAHPLTLAGHVVSVNGKTAQVRANGEVYEVAKEKLKRERYGLIARPACAYCGRTIGETQHKYCNHACMGAHRAQQTDDAIFAAIVGYKKANDGLSPKVMELAAATGYGRTCVEKSLRRLGTAGRIRREGGDGHKQIWVRGGKWTYEGDA